MKVIGITGGVGAGKSTVLAMLKDMCKCDIIMSDDVAKNLMKKGAALEKDAVRLFGKDAYDKEGNLNNGKIAGIIYGNEELKKQWSGIVHPAVNEEIFGRIEADRKSGEYDFVFVEAALLIENNYDRVCDELWYVYADENVRIQRLAEQRNYSQDKSKSIMKAQKTDAEFRKYCGFVIDTGDGIENTRRILENKLEEYVEI